MNIKRRLELVGGMLTMCGGFALLMMTTTCTFTNDSSHYIGNWDGTNWRGYKSGNITLDIIDEMGSTAKITRNNNYVANNLIIPDRVERDDKVYSLIKIDNSAFRDCYVIDGHTGYGDLTGKLIIGNNVVTIGNHAFQDCRDIIELTLGHNVVTIGLATFRDCNNLGRVLTIPDSVTTISDEAFYGCHGLNQILRIGNKVTTIGDFAFMGWINLTGTLMIPDSVITIGECAFYNCWSITSLKIGNNVTIIGYRAFAECLLLSGTLTIPNNISVIDDYAFYDCTNLNEIIIGENVTTIGAGAFKNCNSLISSINNENNKISIVNNDNIYYIRNGSVYYCLGGFNNVALSGTLPTNAVIKDGTKIICNEAFYLAIGGNLTIPTSVIDCGIDAFIGFASSTNSRLLLPGCDSYTNICNYSGMLGDTINGWWNDGAPHYTLEISSKTWLLANIDWTNKPT